MRTISSALKKKIPANTVSAIGRLPALGRLSHDSAASGTLAIVSVAKGRSCQRGSNTEPKAAPVAITIIAIRTIPRANEGNDRVLLSPGPINSTNAGSERPDIRASAASSGVAAAAASSEPHRSQPPNPKLSYVILSIAIPSRIPAIVAEMPTAIHDEARGFHGLRRWLSQAAAKTEIANIIPLPISGFHSG